MAAAVISLLLLLSIYCLATAQPTQSIISLGSSLSPASDPSSWLSSCGHFAFGFYKHLNGFAVGIWLHQIPERTIVWTADRDGEPASNQSTLLLSKEGWLVLRNSRGQDKFIANMSSSASSASMLNSGNFVLYNVVSEVIWQSFDYPTDTMLVGMLLASGKQLFSSTSEADHSTGRFRLTNQGDGNLVLYPVETTDIAENAYWASKIFDQGYRTKLALDGDGRLYLIKDDGSNALNFTRGWSSLNQTVIYRATADFDGNFRLYSHSFDRNGGYSMEIRSSALDNGCLVKGI